MVCRHQREDAALAYSKLLSVNNGRSCASPFYVRPVFASIEHLAEPSISAANTRQVRRRIPR